MDSFEIDIIHDVTIPDDLEFLLETAVIAVLVREEVRSLASVSILLTSDDRIQELNRQYRDVDEITDVLSFPAGEPMPGMDPLYLGDIAVSVPYAGRQAQAGGHNLTTEIILLVVHGVLHLLGFDHAEPEEKKRMWDVQSAVMAYLGLPYIGPTEG